MTTQLTMHDEPRQTSMHAYNASGGDDPNGSAYAAASAQLGRGVLRNMRTAYVFRSHGHKWRIIISAKDSTPSHAALNPANTPAAA